MLRCCLSSCLDDKQFTHVGIFEEKALVQKDKSKMTKHGCHYASSKRACCLCRALTLHMDVQRGTITGAMNQSSDLSVKVKICRPSLKINKLKWFPSVEHDFLVWGASSTGNDVGWPKSGNCPEESMQQSEVYWNCRPAESAWRETQNRGDLWSN